MAEPMVPIVHRDSSGLLVADVAREVVANLAPQELDFFDEVASAWAAGEVTRSVRGDATGWQGGAVGSGLDPQLISLVIFPVLVGAIGQIMGAAGDRGLRRLWRLRKRRRRPEPLISAAVLGRAADLRAACLSEALAAGLPRPRAELIADAVYGAILRMASDPGR